jgi:diguanylate cyclase (GGDEF)-like protein
MIPDADLPPGSGPRGRSWRTWALWSEPDQLIVYLLAIDVLAVGGIITATLTGGFSASAAWRTVLLLTLAIAFEEGTNRAGRLRLRLSEHLKPDMTSVWFVAAAIILPAPYAVACVGLLLCYMWFRRQRSEGELAYRKLGTAATIVIACLVTHWVVGFIAGHGMVVPGGVTGAVAVLIALLSYTVVNRTLVTFALILLRVRGRALAGTWEDNLLELATLCLGGLLTLAVRDQPWLAVLVLLPMVLLQRGALTHQLEIAASTDSKTGLLNAITWEQLAQRELARAHRAGYPTAMFIIDLDRFKAVNDIHGHLVGDEALKAIGQCLQSELRDYDSVGRFGGEEFVALLPTVSEARALEIADRLRAVINRIRISDLVQLTDPATDIRLAASIGVACSPVDGAELMDILHAADAALYVAKQGGRNRVELASRDTAESDVVVQNDGPSPGGSGVTAAA